MNVSKVAAWLGAGLLAITPVVATGQPPAAPFASSGYSFSAAERLALAPVAQAVSARDWAAANALLPAAQAAARGADARYAVGRLQLDVGIATANRQLQYRGIQTIFASGGANQAEQAVLYRHLGSVYYDSGTYREAESMLRRSLELQPNDPDTIGMLGQVSRERRNNPQALTLLTRSIQLLEAGNRPVPENRYRLALNLALEAATQPAAQPAQRAVAADYARRLVLTYPSQANWRDALTAYRDVAPADPALMVDLYRLTRATGALAGERDYLRAANAFEQAGASAEAKAVIDAGVQAGMLDASDSVVRALLTNVTRRTTQDRAGLSAQVTQARAGQSGTASRAAGDALYGVGRYAEAAELYQLAATQGGEDAGLIALRAGAAYALAGQRPAAETALRTVTGSRADLAGFWLAWLAQRPS